MSYSDIDQWMAIIRTVAAVAMLIGSVIYWSSWKRRAKDIAKSRKETNS